MKRLGIEEMRGGEDEGVKRVGYFGGGMRNTDCGTRNAEVTYSVPGLCIIQYSIFLCSV